MKHNELQYQTVKPILRSTLDRLMEMEEFRPFRLVGGTSLSLRYGHRIFNRDFTLNSSIITEEVLASPAYIIDTTSTSLEKNIFKKIEDGSLPLSDFIRFSRGIKTSDDKRFIINEQRNSDCKKSI